MGKAINELDSFAGPVVDGTLIPVASSDTLKKATASQLKTYIVANLGNAATKNTGTTTGTVAAGDHTHSNYAGTGAIGSSGLTMSTAKLLGRSTASTGAVEEITLGTNLSFSGTTLNAAGGSASPGGSDTQVQYNSSGAFAGSTKMVYSDASTLLTVGSGTAGTAGVVLGYAGTSGWSGIGRTGVTLGVGSNDSLTFQANRALLAGGTSVEGYVNGSQRWVTNGTGTYPNNAVSHTLGLSSARWASWLSSISTAIVAKTGNYTATITDHTITVDASGGAVTITGYACSGNAGRRLTIKKTDSSANAVTFDPNASETVDGASTKATSTQYAGFTVQVNADGTAWFVVATF